MQCCGAPRDEPAPAWDVGGQRTETLSLDKARDMAFNLNSRKKAPAPRFLGREYWRKVPFETIEPYMNWGTFFAPFGVTGVAEFDPMTSPKSGNYARAWRLFHMANDVLVEMKLTRIIQACASIAILPAHKIEHEDICVQYAKDFEEVVRFM